MNHLLTCIAVCFGCSFPKPAAPTTIAVDAIQPQLAIDADGTIYCTYLHQGNICVSRSTDSGRTFTKPVIAIDVRGKMKGGLHRGPRIAVDSRKNLTVTAPAVFDEAEFQKKYPTADLFVVTSTDQGQTWTKPVRVNEVPKQAPEALHWLAVDFTSGDAHIVWLDRRDRSGPGQDLYYAKMQNGRVGKNRRIVSDLCECCATGLAVDHHGNVLLAYREGGTKPSRGIFAIHSSDGGATFQPPVQLNRRPSLEDG